MKTKLKLTIFTLIIVAGFLAASSTYAATCNDIADGNWSSSSTWDCAKTPTSSDTITIDSHTVTVDAAASAASVTISGGTFNMVSYTLTVGSGGWTYSSGSVDAGTSRLKLSGTNFTFTPGSVDYYDLELNHQGSNTISGTANVTHNLYYTPTGVTSINTGTINVEGDVSHTTASGGGTATINLMGTGDQTISSTGGGAFPYIAVDKSSGTVSLSGSIYLSVWTFTNGLLDAGTSKLVFGSSATFTPGSVDYYDVQFSGGGGYATISGTANISHDFYLSMVGGFSVAGTANVYGDVYRTTTLGASGSTLLINLVGSTDQTINTVANGGLYNVTINKDSGTVYVTSDILIYGNWLVEKGDLDMGTNTLKWYAGQYPSFKPGNGKYYKIEIDNDYTSRSVTLQSNLYVTEELKLIEGTINNSGNYVITTKDFVQTGGTVSMGSGAMKVTGNFTRTGGTFTYGTSVVSFLGTNQTIDVTGAATTFYKLYKLVNAADTLTITAGNTITIASGGVMRFWGKPEGKTLSIVSSSPSTAYNITKTGDVELEYCDWTDANFSAAVTSAASTDTSGNTNLSVTKEFISTIRSSGGDYTTLSGWESAVNCDLTAATTLVFSHGGITGTIADNSAVTGATSGATGTAVHVTSTQILIKSITGTFQSGEQVYETLDTNYVTTSDAGYGAIATAEPYNDWASGLSDSVTVGGWTTDATHYVNIYVLMAQRHKGKTWTDSTKTVYNGFAIVNNSYFAIGVIQDYSRLSGVIINHNNVTASGYAGLPVNGGYSKINAVILFNCPNGPGGFNLDAAVWYQPTYISNSISYDNYNGMASGYAPNYQSVTVIDSTAYGIEKTNALGTFTVKNALVKNSATADFYTVGGTLSVNYSASSDGTADDLSGSNNRVSQTFSFADETNDDFHLADTDAGAKGYGTDLSVDPDFPVIDDIDGQTRPVWDAWDIGADQSAKKIYRSVGPGATAALQSGSTNALNISSQIASFASALPDNVGVGDAIQYDSDNNGSIDAVAIISERYSSTSYKVLNAAGNTPTQTSAADNDWSIYRAYASLFKAESGDENDGLSDTIEAFEDWSNGKDLIADDFQWNIACYANGTTADTTAVGIGGWTTSATNYLRIYTPIATNEVGESQRHEGAWDTGKYIHAGISTSSSIGISNNYIYIDGLQINAVGSGNYRNSGIETSSANDYIYISNCIIKNSKTGASGTAYGINAVSVSKHRYIWNNIIYDFVDGTNDLRGISGNYGIYYIYNNTVFNCYKGISAGGTMIAKNNITQNCTDGYYGTFSSSDYNISDVSSDTTGGAHDQDDTIVQFQDAANDDFHLFAQNTAARNSGTDLSSDTYLPFSTDIDGQTRLGTWDIGADERMDPKASGSSGGTFKIEGDFNLR